MLQAALWARKGELFDGRAFAPYARLFRPRRAGEVAPDLPGKLIAHRTQNGILRLRISEAEA